MQASKAKKKKKKKLTPKQQWKLIHGGPRNGKTAL